MEYLLTFIIVFLVLFLVYYFYFVEFARRSKKCPVEATYLIRLYKLDIDKFSYRKFLFYVSIVTSMDIAIATTVISMFKELVWQILFGIIVIIPIIAISFIIIGKIYSKKQSKDNSKFLSIFKRKKGNDKHD